MFFSWIRLNSAELRFCTGSNRACSVSEIHDGEDLWQWSQLEIRLNTFHRSTIPQKQFIIIIIKHLVLRKTHVLKTSIFSERNLKKYTSFEEEKGTRDIRGKVYFGIIIFSCLSSTKPCLRFLLICFTRLLSEFLRKWGWFHGHNERFPKYLG